MRERERKKLNLNLYILLKHNNNDGKKFKQKTLNLISLVFSISSRLEAINSLSIYTIYIACNDDESRNETPYYIIL